MAIHTQDYLRIDKMPHIWCPGCGTGIIDGALVRAIGNLGYDRNNVMVITGIGCSARTNAILDFNTFQTTHGRALGFATGFKLARPEMKVIVITGDGDGAGIGGNHLIQTARRNIDITTILINNSIYGMTGGQYSPLTPLGSYATTAPYGTVEDSFDVCKLVEAAGATYVARATAYHVTLLEKLIMKAIEHRGFSFVEAISQCPVGFGRRNKMKTPTEMLKWQKENAINIKAASNYSEEQLAGKFFIGEFVVKEKSEYIERYNALKAKAQKRGE
ncbi:thiamine pyrophosphate-dependent enzyme [Candidatus Formimonas warabiya]|uniref:2-oxoacid:ferredoxin oxidoreductase subunit beta n=1 Tax=Formimonas warabiya TaxID=1761012 RepID=A0A3G1KM17_FORW1|nr:thiamine pyrophosphate-dependent enzyme [Candidatus Formimonas warabiya]ATW23468.1 2-oxoacid:ferredoxin oxidoreductase subunit beta [Candidatus Formimonas warabiya]